MRKVDRLHLLLVSAVLCGLVQLAAGQSSAKAEVLSALAERDKAFVAGDETKVAQSMADDYLQTDIWGNVQDKQAWLDEYYCQWRRCCGLGKVGRPPLTEVKS